MDYHIFLKNIVYDTFSFNAIKKSLIQKYCTYINYLGKYLSCECIPYKLKSMKTTKFKDLFLYPRNYLKRYLWMDQNQL